MITRYLCRHLVPALVLALGLVSAREACATESDLRIHITDLGINQVWDDWMLIGDPLRVAHPQVFPELQDVSGAQILLPMPTDHQLRTLSEAQLTEHIASRLKASLERAVGAGVSEIEIRLVEHISELGYATPGRQDLVDQFGRVAYRAIGQALESLQAKGHRVGVDASLGSNGTKMFAESLASWRGWSHLLTAVDMAGGRASLESVRAALRVLGSSRVSITNSRHDLWAPSPVTSAVYNATRNPFLPEVEPSIGNLGTLKKLVLEFEGLRAYLLTPLEGGLAHIRRMVEADAQFQMEQLVPDGQGGVGLEPLPGIYTGREIRSANLAGRIPGLPELPQPSVAFEEVPQLSVALEGGPALSGRDRSNLQLSLEIAPTETRRVLIAGEGPALEFLYRAALIRFGPDNVTLIRTSQTRERVQRQARNFGADLILRVDKPEPPRRRRERR